MKIFLTILLFFLLLEDNLYASKIENITKKLKQTENISFNFIQTIGGKDEKGECTIQYPKKIFCRYDNRHNKIIVSNGSSLVIKTDMQYYRYPIKKTPLEFILDKDFLINKIKSSNMHEVQNKYIFIKINENNNNISVFFSKENYELVGWQVEDVYQNLAITYIFNTSVNNHIDKKLFKLPTHD
tara:strand:+ start:278 stop:829 length:552 start_codon:yes stop_codon:yes gene_type:complete